MAKEVSKNEEDTTGDIITNVTSSMDDTKPLCVDATTASGRMIKNLIGKLSELRPDASFELVAEYGAGDDTIYVMEIKLDGKKFQGIGASKKRAKGMAAGNALVHLGILCLSGEPPPELSTWPAPKANDFTADITDDSPLYFDFKNALSTRGFDINPTNVFGRPDDDFLFEVDETSRNMLGKNPVTILAELRPDAIYEAVMESDHPANPQYVWSVTVDDKTYTGSGVSKKLAKARAARVALDVLYKLEFVTSESGMPIYEGDSTVWQHFKFKLESQAEAALRLSSSSDSLEIIHKIFPYARYEYIENNKAGVSWKKFVTRITILDQTYEGAKDTRLDATAEAAANAVVALRSTGVLYEKEWEMEEIERKRLIALNVRPIDGKSAPISHNAIAKLNILFPGLVTFADYAEEPLFDSPLINSPLITVFTLLCRVHGKSFVGVAKTKKAAKMEAAEKALKYFCQWMLEDEANKVKSMKEHDDPVVSISRLREQAKAKRIEAMRSQLSTDRRGFDRDHNSRDEFGGRRGDMEESRWDNDAWDDEEDDWCSDRNGRRVAPTRVWRGNRDPVKNSLMVDLGRNVDRRDRRRSPQRADMDRYEEQMWASSNSSNRRLDKNTVGGLFWRKRPHPDTMDPADHTSIINRQSINFAEETETRQAVKSVQGNLLLAKTGLTGCGRFRASVANQETRGFSGTTSHPRAPTSQARSEHSQSNNSGWIASNANNSASSYPFGQNSSTMNSEQFQAFHDGSGYADATNLSFCANGVQAYGDALQQAAMYSSAMPSEINAYSSGGYYESGYGSGYLQGQGFLSMPATQAFTSQQGFYPHQGGSDFTSQHSGQGFSYQQNQAFSY